MKPVQIQGIDFIVRQVGVESAEAILSVYRRCEDFLALGPVAQASMAMVLDDLKHSREGNGIFCGIYLGDEMAGIVDYVPDNFESQPGCAFLSLLMIAEDHRARGLGRKVVDAVEAEILKNSGITAIRSGVQANNPKAIGFWQRMGYAINGPAELMPDSTAAYPLYKRV